jgi:hypothetical protein
MSKTRHSRPPGRIVQIHRDSIDGKLLAVVRASTLKQALQEYYKNTLEPQGYHSPVYTGNVLTVVFRKQNAVRWVATEVK